MKKFEDIKTICNLGCGTMGFGTAIAFAKSGYEVNMFGRKDASIERAMKNIHFTLDVMKANDLLTEEEEKGLLSRIHGVTTLKTLLPTLISLSNRLQKTWISKKPFTKKWNPT